MKSLWWVKDIESPLYYKLLFIANSIDPEMKLLSNSDWVNNQAMIEQLYAEKEILK